QTVRDLGEGAAGAAAGAADPAGGPPADDGAGPGGPRHPRPGRIGRGVRRPHLPRPGLTGLLAPGLVEIEVDVDLEADVGPQPPAMDAGGRVRLHHGLRLEGAGRCLGPKVTVI